MEKLYLGILILDKFSLKDKFMLIDEYYEKIEEISKDFILKDNKNKSMLDSANEYIENNNIYIYETIKDCFE